MQGRCRSCKSATPVETWHAAAAAAVSRRRAFTLAGLGTTTHGGRSATQLHGHTRHSPDIQLVFSLIAPRHQCQRQRPCVSTLQVNSQPSQHWRAGACAVNIPWYKWKIFESAQKYLKRTGRMAGWKCLDTSDGGGGWNTGLQWAAVSGPIVQVVAGCCCSSRVCTTRQFANILQARPRTDEWPAARTGSRHPTQLIGN